MIRDVHFTTDRLDAIRDYCLESNCASCLLQRKKKMCAFVIVTELINKTYNYIKEVDND